MKRANCIILILLAAILTASCVTSRRVDYLQDMTMYSQIQVENRFEARIAPYDELSIVVMSSDLEGASLAEPFNKSGNGYLVDVNGNIELPTLGKMHVAGLTRLRLQDTLTARLSRGGYMSSPFVNVRFSNFKIFCLIGGTGSVLNIPNERCTFLEALAMMGGLENHVQRDNIAVMREVNGKMVMRYLDPRSSDIFNDPFFMLQQNDFIIAPTYNASTALANLTTITSIFTALASTASLVATLMLYRSMTN